VASGAMGAQGRGNLPEPTRGNKRLGSRHVARRRPSGGCAARATRRPVGGTRRERSSEAGDALTVRRAPAHSIGMWGDRRSRRGSALGRIFVSVGVGMLALAHHITNKSNASSPSSTRGLLP
jgi:hypothetical protein